MSTELRDDNRLVYFRKAVSSPELTSESVLTREPYQYVELWLKRECKDALPYWLQSKAYYQATKSLPAVSAPLTAYYCYLNAAKALLTVRGVKFKEWHGVSGAFDPTSKRSLANEMVKIKGAGILSSLSAFLDEPEPNDEHSLSDILGNLPFIHRAYRQTFTSKKELFVPLSKPHYRKHPHSSEVWFAADIKGHFADRRSLSTFPNAFEHDEGCHTAFRIRTKRRKRWYLRGAKAADKSRAHKRLCNLHKKCRLKVTFISAPVSLWYLKRNHSSATIIDRYGMTLIMAAMHRLSELARYDPQGLNAYFEGKPNWLLSEFIELASDQFLDELICEMTGKEFRLPGVRP